MSVRVLIGDALDQLRTLPDESVHCCVTSPPYFGLRDYGVAGQIGLEPTPDAYIAKLVEVFREVRRVLRDDGTLWLNLGDSYVANRGNTFEKPGFDNKAAAGHAGLAVRQFIIPGKPKDLLMIPARVALALQADGWWLRSEIIWAKPNPMPESVTDRPTSSHEKIYLLSKAERYYFDQDAVRSPAASSSVSRWAQNVECQQGSARAHAGGKTNGTMKAVGGILRKRPNGQPTTAFIEGENTCGVPELGVNIRNVWTVATSPYSEAHFATFPPEIPERCIKAGAPKGGTVLDPFFGAGTTGLVADRLGRHAIGIELNPAYAEMARQRIANDAGMFAQVSAQVDRNPEGGDPLGAPSRSDESAVASIASDAP